MRTLRLPLLAALVVAIALVAGCQSAPATAPTAASAAKPTASAVAAPTSAPTVAPAAAPAKATDVPVAAKVDFPAKGKTITFIVGWAAGSGPDVNARALASQLEKQLGVPIQILNDPAVSTQSALTRLVQSKPDGYTIEQSVLPTNITSYLDPSRNAPYGRKDLLPVAGYGEVSVGISVRTDSPYKTFKDLADAAKAKPGQITMGTSGVLGIGHLVLLMLEKQAGLKFAIVQYPGGDGALPALLGGHIDAYCTALTTFVPPYRSGTVRILASSDHQRDKLLPDVPTFEEQGYKVYLLNNFGVIAPARTPQQVVNILTTNIKTALEAPDVKQKFADVNTTIDYMDPSQYASFWNDTEASVVPLMSMARN